MIRLLLRDTTAILRGLVLALAVWSAGAAQAQATQTAEEFVRTQAPAALATLNNPRLTTADRTREFQRLMTQVADLDRIAFFVLGRYGRTFPRDRYPEYLRTFREYALVVYQTQLDQYRGDAVRVIRSETDRSGDTIVYTQIPSKARGETLEAVWRVRTGPNGPRVIDVRVFGVWLAIQQKSDFEAVINRAANQPEAIIAHMRNFVATAQTERGWRPG
jgi:phospholipid transport system substrate-binding protein